MRYRIMTFNREGVAVPSFDSLESESPFPNLLGQGEFWAEIPPTYHVHKDGACDDCQKIADSAYQQGDEDHDHSTCGACDEVYDQGYEAGKKEAQND